MSKVCLLVISRREVSGAGKTEDGLVRYNEEVNRPEDDLRELYETIRVNVDEEEQWKVFDFVEDFFMEELEIGDYINDINSYHLHMFGKHDVTTKKLDVIVEKAGKVDANYAAQIEGYCSLLGEYGKKFETVCAMLALDLIGVKVFRYSDETAEAVASGEKLLKESGTIYESFADMMSPEDAKRYLDFLENGSREGLTSAELAGVEKADALLVSRKVGYEDVWDLRNAGDLLESGRESSIMDYSNRFADSLAEDFNHGVEVRDVVKEDMILVQFSSDAPNASLRYWTTIDEANGISTIEEYMDKMALSKEWGNRNVVKVARVKKGTEVTHAIGTAKAQTKISDPRPGNGKQILFSKFDSNWITEVRNIKE